MPVSAPAVPVPAEMDKLLNFLRSHYPFVTIKDNGNVCVLERFAFTWAILSDCCYTGYADRWCYSSPQQALAALLDWSGAEGTEPAGWHRHPRTGRRRPSSDPFQEYVHL